MQINSCLSPTNSNLFGFEKWFQKLFKTLGLGDITSLMQGRTVLVMALVLKESFRRKLYNLDLKLKRLTDLTTTILSERIADFWSLQT